MKHASARAEERHAPSARWALTCLSLSMLLPSLATSITTVGLPALVTEFNASFRAAQWIILAYLLAITALIVIAGRLGDILGRRRLLLLGIALFTAASVACALAPSIPFLLAARVAQGVGAAIMTALTMALVTDVVPRARVGGAMGLLGTMSAIGTTLGPSLGGILIALLGWRMIFLANVPLGVVAFLLARSMLPDDAPRFDSRASAPVLHWGMLRDATLRVALSLNVLLTAVVMAMLVIGPFFLSRVHGLDVAAIGLVISAGPLASALTGVAAGSIVDRRGVRLVTTIGLAGMVAGLFALALVPATFGVAGYVTASVIVTAHYALFQTANNTAVMTGVTTDQRGVVAGLLGLSRHLGLIAGASGMGTVFAYSSGTSAITNAAPGAVATGMRTTFIVAGLVVLAALIAQRLYARTATSGDVAVHSVIGDQGVMLPMRYRYRPDWM